jgi:hypothetical protein
MSVAPQKTNAKTTKQGRKQQANERRRTWKTRHAGPPWIRSASFSAPILYTLAGARGGTVGVTLRIQEQSVKSPSIRHTTPRKATPYLKEEKARFLFLEVPADVAPAPIRPVPPLP